MSLEKKPHQTQQLSLSEWQTERQIYQKRISELEKEVLFLKNSNLEILNLLKTNVETGKITSGQTNLKTNPTNNTTSKGIKGKDVFSKKSSDESEIHTFKKKLINSRKTKSYGAYNLNEILNEKKAVNKQNININLFSSIQSVTQTKKKKQDSDPLKVMSTLNNFSSNNSNNFNNTMNNPPIHLQIKQFYKEAKSQKTEKGDKTKYFLSNIDESVFNISNTVNVNTSSSILNEKEKEKEKGNGNSHNGISTGNGNNTNNSSCNKKINKNGNGNGNGNTAQIVSNLLSSNYSSQKSLEKQIKKVVTSISTLTNKDKQDKIIKNNSKSKEKLFVDEKNISNSSKILMNIEKKGQNQIENLEKEVNKRNKTTTNEKINESLSLSISSITNMNTNTNNNINFTLNKKQQTQNQRKIILQTTTNNSSYILENSTNSNKTQETMININNLYANKSSLNNSLRDSIQSLQFNMSINSNSPKSSPFIVYKHHLDSVRVLDFVNNSKFLVSAGDDMVINLWSLMKNNEVSKEIKEPYISLRGHNNPIHTLTSKENTFFSSGIDGIIKSWRVPERYLSTDSNLSNNLYSSDSSLFQVASWQGSSEMIWSMKIYKGNKDFLATASADGVIRIWNVQLKEDSLIDKKVLYTFSNTKTNRSNICQLVSKSLRMNVHDIPTCIEWENESRLISSYVSPIINVFDVETRKVLISTSFQSEIDKSLLHNEQQVNSLVFNKELNLTVTGHENRHIKFFDFRQNDSLIKTIIGHTDSVSQVEFGNGEFDLLSGCHSGSLRSWDIRNFNLMNDINCSKQKNSEGVLCIKSNKLFKGVVTSGADSLIKLYKTN